MKNILFILTAFLFYSPVFADEIDELRKNHIELKSSIRETDLAIIKTNRSNKTSDYDKTIGELDGLTGTISKLWDKNEYWNEILKSIDESIEILMKQHSINRYDIEIMEKTKSQETGKAVREQRHYGATKEELRFTVVFTNLSIKEDIFTLKSENRVISSKVSYLRRVRKYALQKQKLLTR